MRPQIDASLSSLRTTAQGSGSMRIGPDLLDYSLPVSMAHCETFPTSSTSSPHEPYTSRK
jgi:hypothetical protein